MHYVYLLQSESHPSKRYVGLTSDLKIRLTKHNAGASMRFLKRAKRVLETS